MFSSWLLVLSCLVLAVPLWDPLAARPRSDDAVADVSRVLMVFSRWLVGVECQLLALPPDGKWCVGTCCIMLDNAVAKARDSKANLVAALDLAPPSPPIPGVWGTLSCDLSPSLFLAPPELLMSLIVHKHSATRTQTV